MSNQLDRPRPSAVMPDAELEGMLDEFSIMELEDRLELADRCNSNDTNCDCTPTKPAT